MTTELLLGPNDDGRRADRILRKALPDLPLSALHRLFRAGKIRVQGKRIKADSRLHEGDSLSIAWRVGERDESSGRIDTPSPPSPPDSRRLEILFQNEDFLVANKGEGILVHGPDSLEEAVLQALAESVAASLSFRPGPLHRLDQGTSGIIVFSASLEGARSFSKALHDHKLQKDYLALLWGNLDRELCLEDRLERDKDGKKTLVSVGGKSARTLVWPLASAQTMTLARIRIEGGRTHQIRAHLGGAGFPLVNDCKYSGPRRPELNGGRFLLHAQRLEQENDISLNLPKKLEAPVPPEFLHIIATVFGPEAVRLMLY